MQPKKILVVDDDRVILKSMSLKLTACGYEVSTAEDAASAVSMARQVKPDLILLDLSFPPDVSHGGIGWDGFQIMTWLRRLDEARDIPIVVVTGCDFDKCKDRALAAGALSFFHKPINSSELVAVIRKALGEAPAAAGRPSPAPSQAA